jgi:hypothetical protein
MSWKRNIILNALHKLIDGDSYGDVDEGEYEGRKVRFTEKHSIPQKKNSSKIKISYEH